jgi:hypothetical protein
VSFGFIFAPFLRGNGTRHLCYTIAYALLISLLTAIIMSTPSEAAQKRFAKGFLDTDERRCTEQYGDHTNEEKIEARIEDVYP